MKGGSTVIDLGLCKDTALEAYRDAIGHLGSYRDGCGSAVDGIGARVMFAKRVLGSTGRATVGTCVNCAHDRVSQGGMGSKPVLVPKMHPLFDLESDDPLPIPSILGRN
jgi:hypothetical protein